MDRMGCWGLKWDDYLLLVMIHGSSFPKIPCVFLRTSKPLSHWLRGLSFTFRWPIRESPRNRLVLFFFRLSSRTNRQGHPNMSSQMETRDFSASFASEMPWTHTPRAGRKLWFPTLKVLPRFPEIPEQSKSWNSPCLCSNLMVIYLLSPLEPDWRIISLSNLLIGQ